MCAPKKLTKKPEKVIIHEDYKTEGGSPVNDIALIRLDEPVILYSEDPIFSGASPICLPWDSEDPGRELLARSLLNSSILWPLFSFGILGLVSVPFFIQNDNFHKGQSIKKKRRLS